MTIQELQTFLQRLPEQVLSDAAEIIAATATEHFRENFNLQGFDGDPWEPLKTPKTRGGILVSSGALANSIVPLEVSSTRVVISAGNQRVPYARAHNEGVDTVVTVPAFTRRLGRRGKTTQVRTHTRSMRLPRRQFMGASRILNERIHQRISGYISTITH